MAYRTNALRKVLGLGIKYAPLAYEGLRHGRKMLPDTGATGDVPVGRPVNRRAARSYAMEHAAHLVDGSVLPVYEGDRRVWVVFSGDRPVATHPVVSTPLPDLLAHYDLSRRIRPAAPSRRLARRRVGTGWPSADQG